MPAFLDLRARLYGVMRRMKGPKRLRSGCLYLGAGFLTLRHLRAASVSRWEGYGTDDAHVEAGFEDWEARLYGDVLRPTDRLLLVGCGAGRDLVALRRLGCEVTGLEQSPRLAEQARGHLRRLGLDARVIAETVESYVSDEAFDAIVFSLYMYSCLIGEASRIAILMRCRKRLSTGGRVIISYSALQPQSRVWIFLARAVSVCSCSDWWPQDGDRLYGPPAQPDVLDLEHQSSPDEVAHECRAAGLRVIRDEPVNWRYRFAIAVV
jgi:SAM-dependent methyltransferase